MTTLERSAYSAAWRVRRQTGNASADVLTAQLRTHGVDAVWTDPESELHVWLYECWRRGVGPSRLPFEASKQAITFLPAIVRPLREILKHLR